MIHICCLRRFLFAVRNEKNCIWRKLWIFARRENGPRVERIQIPPVAPHRAWSVRALPLVRLKLCSVAVLPFAWKSDTHARAISACQRPLHLSFAFCKAFVIFARMATIRTLSQSPPSPDLVYLHHGCRPPLPSAISDQGSAVGGMGGAVPTLRPGRCTWT